MKEYITIIGLGKFGLFMAKHLQMKGIDVQILEKDENIAQANRDLANEIKMGDATKKTALEGIDIQNAKEVIVSIRSNIESSLMIVLNLKELGVQKIRAMAVSEIHTKLLREIGATDILNPDEYLAKDMADKIKNPYLLGNLSCFEGRVIVKQAPPNNFIGKSLKELNLNREFDIIVTDILDSENNRIMPTGDHVITEDETLIMLGPKDTLEALAKKQCRELH